MDIAGLGPVPCVSIVMKHGRQRQIIGVCIGGGRLGKAFKAGAVVSGEH